MSDGILHDCDGFTDSKESEEVIKEYKILGYCLKHKCNLGIGGCQELCELKLLKKDKKKQVQLF